MATVSESLTISSTVNAAIETRASTANVSTSESSGANSGCRCLEVECFPADATVDVFNVGKVPLSSLEIGALVRVVDATNQIRHSPVIAFLHRDLNEQALYRRVRTKSAVIELSQRHLIHQRRDGFVWAEKLRLGDEILVVPADSDNQTQWEEILNISDVHKQGLMAPLTDQGTIIVNNVHASCYALVKTHQLGHMALAPYRWYRRFFGSLSDGQNTTTPILSYANVLLNFFKSLPIAKDLIF